MRISDENVCWEWQEDLNENCQCKCCADFPPTRNNSFTPAKESGDTNTTCLQGYPTSEDKDKTVHLLSMIETITQWKN